MRQQESQEGDSGMSWPTQNWSVFDMGRCSRTPSSANCQTFGKKKNCLLTRSGFGLVSVWMSGKCPATFWPLSEAIWPLWFGWVCHKCLCRLAITGCLCRPGNHWSSSSTESHPTIDERIFFYITIPLSCTHEYQ